MKYLKFESLSNGHSVKGNESIESLGITNEYEQWMVTEKVHGANMGLYSNGQDLLYANRSAIIGDIKTLSVGFYNSYNVVKSIEVGVKNFCKQMIDILCQGNEVLRDRSYIVVYGELYGGSVQKKMPYGKEQKFIAFDAVSVLDNVFLSQFIEMKKSLTSSSNVTFVRDNPEDKSADPLGRIVAAFDNKIELYSLLNQHGIDTVPVLMTGTYEQCKAYNVEFNSWLVDDTYVKELKLTEEQEANRMSSEGIVIEPVNPYYEYEKRIILKKRSKKFEEKKHPKAEKTYSQKLLDSMSEETKAIYVMMSDMVCENRFDSVVSKIGEVGIKDFDKVLSLMFADVVETAENEADINILKILGKIGYREVKTVVMNEIAHLIRPLLLAM